MSNGVTDEGVGWKVKADLSEVFAAYDKAEEASKRAGDVAAEAAQKAGDAAIKAGTAAQKMGTSIDASTASGAKGFRGLSDTIDRTIGRVNEANSRFQALQGRVTALRGSLAQGAGMSAGDLIGQIQAAGGLRGFVAGAGGPLAAAALTTGVAYGVAKQYSDLQETADKANLTARELDGLQKVMSKLGVDAAATNGMMTEFARRMLDAGDDGQKLTKVLQDNNIAVTDGNGVLRPYLAILSDAAQAIRATTDEQKKMEIATAAVGQTFATQFLDAISKSETGLKNLQSATAALSGSLTNDLGRAGRTAIQILKEIGDQAEGTYAQIKTALRLGDANDRLNAAAQDVKNARLNYTNSRAGIPVGSVEGVGGVMPTQEALARDVLRAQLRLAEERERMGLPRGDDVDLKHLGQYGVNASGVFRSGKDVYGPNLPEKKGDGDDEEKAARGRSKSAAAAKELDDNYASVSKRLRDQLGLLQTTGVEHDQLALKLKQEVEIQKLGKDATQEEKDKIAELVAQIDEATKKQKELNEAAKGGAEAYKSLAGSISSSLKELIAGGKPGDIAKRLLSSVSGSLLDAGLTGSGPFANLFGTAGKDGALGGLFGMLGDALGIGGKSASTMNVKAGVVNVGGAGIGGGGLFGDLFGGLFGGGGEIPFAGLFAEGGDIPSGQFGIVGEKGAEVVRGPASVTPWHRAAGLFGGGSKTTHNHFAFSFQTPDAQSFVRSEAQVSAMLLRAVARGQRNM